MFGRLSRKDHTENVEPGEMAELAAIASDVEAGNITLPPRWAFERTPDGTQLWTTPVGRRYACDDDGNLLPLPDGVADYQPWSRAG